MEEREFNALADAMLARIEAALEACSSDCDFDFETKPGGVLELEFDNGSKIIINRHTAAREIWVAAKSGGYHFARRKGIAGSARAAARNCWPRSPAAWRSSRGAASGSVSFYRLRLRVLHRASGRRGGRVGERDERTAPAG